MLFSLMKYYMLCNNIFYFTIIFSAYVYQSKKKKKFNKLDYRKIKLNMIEIYIEHIKFNFPIFS